VPAVWNTPLHAAADRLAELGEFRAAVIDRRRGDRLQHPVGHIGRAGDLQEMAAGMTGHRVFHRIGSQRRVGADRDSVAGKRRRDKQPQTSCCFKACRLIVIVSSCQMQLI